MASDAVATVRSTAAKTARVRRASIAVLVTAVLVAGGVMRLVAVSGAARPASPPVASSGAAAPPQVGASASKRDALFMPASLRGTAAPALPLEAGGHLARTRAVREFFDYFLTAVDEVSSDAIDAIVRRAIAAQVEGMPAQGEALDVWQRYRGYHDALERTAPLQPQPADQGIDVDAMQATLDMRAVLASRTLGWDWSEAFFGGEWRATAHTLARLRIMADKQLSEAQKTARINALLDSLPPGERAANEREARERRNVETIADLNDRRLSLEELHARATQALGAEMAQRVADMRRDDDAWLARYAAYAEERTRINAVRLPPDEREVKLAQLRERMFADPGERIRAASLDIGALASR